jgi:hypothetical protein
MIIATAKTNSNWYTAPEDNYIAFNREWMPGDNNIVASASGGGGALDWASALNDEESIMGMKQYSFASDCIGVIRDGSESSPAEVPLQIKLYSDYRRIAVKDINGSMAFQFELTE